MNKRVALLLLLVDSMIPAVAGELVIDPVQKIVAEDAAGEALFGSSISVGDDMAVIGASHAGDNGERSGAAYVYRRIDGLWVQDAKLLPADGAPGDEFGDAVSAHGNTVAVGARRAEDDGTRSGTVYVFALQDRVWVQIAKLVPSDGVAGQFFGDCLALEGDTLVVGAFGDDDNGAFSGSAYVFARSQGTWALRTKLLPNDGAAFDFFGSAVALSGDTIVVGATGDDDPLLGDQTGSAYVFARETSAWSQQQRLVASDGRPFDRLGFSVALDGDTAVIGSTLHDETGVDSGAAYVFERSAGRWEQTAEIFPQDGSEGDRFGVVDVDRDVLAVGARGDDDVGEESGSTYVYTREQDGWVLGAKRVAGDGDAGDLYGATLALDLPDLFVGAALDEDNGDREGSVYAYTIAVNPVERVDALLRTVARLDLDRGMVSSLTSKLDAARIILTDMNEANDAAAAHVLGAFARQLEAQRGKKLAPADADPMIREALDLARELDEHPE